MVIIGGGPGGYEAALVAAQLGAEVTLIDRDGLGGSAVLTDCVPSKALVAAATVPQTDTDLATINTRIIELAAAQSRDIAERIRRDGVRILVGTAHLVNASTVSYHGCAAEE